MNNLSHLEAQFLYLWQDLYPELLLEHDFKVIPKRRFKFDFAFIPAKVAIEISGQIWHKGGHSSGKGLLRDYEKLNLGQEEGWIVFQLAEPMITDEWLNKIAKVIKNRLV